jgi:hypothetical protein
MRHSNATVVREHGVLSDPSHEGIRSGKQTLVVPSFGPPDDEPGPLVHRRLYLKSRLGERRAGGIVTWTPGDAAPPVIQ